jgi:hypothetical protein
MGTAAATQSRATAGPLGALLSGIEAVVTGSLKAAQSIASDLIPLVQSGQRLAVIAKGTAEVAGGGDVRGADGARSGDDLLSRLFQGRLYDIPVQTDIGASPSAFLLVGLAGVAAIAAILVAR